MPPNQPTDLGLGGDAVVLTEEEERELWSYSENLSRAKCGAWPNENFQTIHRRDESVRGDDSYTEGRKFVLGTRSVLTTEVVISDIWHFHHLSDILIVSTPWHRLLQIQYILGRHHYRLPLLQE